MIRLLIVDMLMSVGIYLMSYEICSSCSCRANSFVSLILFFSFVFFLMIRRPPRSTQSRSSAASDVYKRQVLAAHRVHGDLHAGQFLRAGDRLLITDFDGNPLADSAERRLPQSPLIDVASMVQSIDHVGRIVVTRRHPDRGAEVAARIATAGPLPEGKNGGPVKVKVVWVERVGLELDELLTGPRPYLYTSRADLQAQN